MPDPKPPVKTEQPKPAAPAPEKPKDKFTNMEHLLAHFSKKTKDK